MLFEIISVTVMLVLYSYFSKLVLDVMFDWTREGRD